MIRPTEAVQSLELSALVAQVTDYAIFALDPAGHVVSWNAGAALLKGYEPAEIVGQHFSRFYLPEDVAAGRPERLLAAAAHDGHVRDEGWRVRKDGARFWADIVITALKDGESGRVAGYLKVTRDLTERRAAQELLRQGEERLRLLVERVDDYAIFMLDPDGRVASWNVGAQRIKGYAPDEVIGRHFSTFYPPEDIAEGRPARELEAAIARGKVEDEGWRVRKDGSRFWANVVITSLRGDDGGLRGFAKVTRDMTSKRRATEELAARARQQGTLAALGVFALQTADLQLVLERAVAAVTTTLEVDLCSISEETDGGLVLRAGQGWAPGDRGALRFVGTSPVAEAWTGGAPVLVTHLPSDPRFADPVLWGRGVVSTLTVPVPGRGPRPFAVLGAHHRAERPFSADDVFFMQAVANIVGAAVVRRQTELDRLEAERQARVADERRAMAEAAVRERDVYVSVVAHELRTPVAALMLKLAGLGKLVSDPSNERRLTQVLPGRLEAASRQTQRLTLLIERILDMSRISSGQLQLEREACDLAALARDVVQDLREHARQRRTAVAIVGAASLPGAWDRGRLLQILTNLVDNAIKYGAGAPIEVVVDGDEACARARVTDQGPGIAPEDQERIFQRFERASPLTQFGGMGLGLYVSKQLALAHGGDIILTSAPGRGSTFELVLPRGVPTGEATT